MDSPHKGLVMWKSLSQVFIIIIANFTCFAVGKPIEFIHTCFHIKKAWHTYMCVGIALLATLMKYHKLTYLHHFTTQYFLGISWLVYSSSLLSILGKCLSILNHVYSVSLSKHHNWCSRFELFFKLNDVNMSHVRLCGIWSLIALRKRTHWYQRNCWGDNLLT